MSPNLGERNSPRYDDREAFELVREPDLNISVWNQKPPNEPAPYRQNTNPYSEIFDPNIWSNDPRKVVEPPVNLIKKQGFNKGRGKENQNFEPSSAKRYQSPS